VEPGDPEIGASLCVFYHEPNAYRFHANAGIVYRLLESVVKPCHFLLSCRSFLPGVSLLRQPGWLLPTPFGVSSPAKELIRAVSELLNDLLQY
jgi:hypothetical protein